MPKYKTARLKLSDLVLHRDLQMRAGVGMIDHDHVDDMVEALKKRGKLPRPKVRNVEGHGFLVTDGFHGVTARKIINPTGTCECDVADGTWTQAVEDAAGSNLHKDAPKKRTNDDKRRAVRCLIEAHRKDGVEWGVQRYADHCHVSDTLVKNVMANLAVEDAPDTTGRTPEPVYIEKRDGTKQKARIAKTPAQKAATAPTGKPKEKYDWRSYDAAFGVVARMPDDLGRASPGVKGTTEVQGVQKLLGELAEAAANLRKLGEKEKS